MRIYKILCTFYTHFIQNIKSTKLEEADILVSFNVVSLYTKIPVKEAIKVITRTTDSGTADLVEVCLKSTYFSFWGDIYEQTNGVATGSPLSPVVANIFMEYFEEMDINTSPLKPKEWRWYVDDTNFVWTHGKDKLEESLRHVNNQSKDMKFTMEIEEDNNLPFLDVLFTKENDGTLAHQVYQKKNAHG